MLELLNSHKFYLTIILIIIVYIIFTNYQEETFTNSYNGKQLFNGSFPKYIYATVDKWGNTLWYLVKNNDAWYYPARKKKKMHKVRTIRYDGGSSGIGEGIEYERDSIIFTDAGAPDNDDYASYGSKGKNSKDAVRQIQPPNVYYKQDPLYLYRWQHGADLVYKVFEYTNPKDDMLNCCKDNKQARHTCLPKYYDTKPDSECHKKMRTYCQTKNNITNSNCNTWYSNKYNVEIGKIDKNNFCNTGNNFKANLKFCTDWSKGDGYGNVDKGVLNYCKTNLSDNSLCSCMQANAQHNLPEEAKQIKEIVKSRPICYSNECSEFGYITKSMKDLVDSCPKCLQVMNFSDIQSDKINFNDLKQSCENKTNNVAVPVQTPITVQPSIENPESTEIQQYQPIPLTLFELFILKIKNIFKL